MDDWGPPSDRAVLSYRDFQTPGVVVQLGEAIYRTTGRTVGEGGMGVAYLIERRELGRRETTRAVAKLYWDQLLEHVEKDPVAQAHFEHNVQVLARLQQIDDLHLMPIFAAERLDKNFLVISPYLGEPLATLIDQDMSPRQRLGLVLQAARGLRTLHDHHIVHNDFTPHNILVGDPESHAAVLFDFDLAVATDLVGNESYLDHYSERIVGAPEYSVSPEVLDPILIRQPIAPQRDIYAVGTTLFSMFTEASIYGDAPDLASLLRKINEGVVRCGVSYIDFPDEVPREIRGIVVRCLERDPADRYPTTSALIRDLERAHDLLSPKSRSRFRTTLDYVHVDRSVKLKDVIETRADHSIEPDEVRRAQGILQRFGYLLEKSLGRVKDHTIYVAVPDPTLVVTGRFKGPNTYRKVVTLIDLRDREDSEEYIVEWMGCIMPILETVRAGHLTALHRVAVDRPSASLILFSEHVDDPRFGPGLEGEELGLREALGLGLIIIDQVARLHEHGLAHNNVRLESLVFKGYPKTGEAEPLFVGLVEPSFAGEDLLRDVQRLADIISKLIHPASIAEAGPEHRPRVQRLAEDLRAIATGTVGLGPIAGLRKKLGDCLASLDDNFGLVREHGGDPVGYARVLVRHSLYRRLWKSKP